MRNKTEATLKQTAARLYNLTLREDKLLLKQQLTCFNQLWVTTKSGLSKKKTLIGNLIDWLKSFSHQEKLILTWLEEVENSVFLNPSPERQRDGIRQVEI